MLAPGYYKIIFRFLIVKLDKAVYEFHYISGQLSI